MLALSIRQPYAELILRGSKRIEYRSSDVKTMLGRRFYIYAAKKKWPGASGQWPEEAARKIWSDDLAVTTPREGGHHGGHQGGPPPWMLELAEELILGKLPTGVIVGSAVIEKVVPPSSLSLHPFFQWHLADVRRATRLRKPTGHPQPVWFEPF